MTRIGLLVLLLATASAHAAETTQAPATAAPLTLQMEVAIAADGQITEVVPAANLPEHIRQALIARVSQWRCEPATWLGQPAAVRSKLNVRAQLARTTDGKQVLQLVDAFGMQPIQEFLGTSTPQYPLAAAKRGVGGTFIHSMYLHPDGSVSEVEPMWSSGEASQGKWAKLFEELLRDTYAKARRAPMIVNGQAIACHTQLTMSFFVEAPPAEPAEVKQAREAAIAAWEAATPDACPVAKLATDVKGMLL